MLDPLSGWPLRVPLRTPFLDYRVRSIDGSMWFLLLRLITRATEATNAETDTENAVQNLTLATPVRATIFACQGTIVTR